MIISKLVMKTGSACSLKCEKCGEFNPYLAKAGKAFRVSNEQLLEDVKKIAEAADEISLLDVAGGEALLHQDLYELVEALTEIEKIKKIHIITNGTIIPNDKMMEIIKSHADKIAVIMSDYTGAGVDHTKTLQAYEEQGIVVKVLQDMKWMDKSNTTFKAYSQDELTYISEHCSTFKREPYYTLIDGKLSAHCPTAGSLMYYLGLYELCAGEFIDIRRQDRIAKCELEQLDEKNTLYACNHCVPSYEAPACVAGLQLAK